MQCHGGKQSDYFYLCSTANRLYHIADVAILPFKLDRPQQSFKFCISCILMCCIERHVLTISTKQQELCLCYTSFMTPPGGCYNLKGPFKFQSASLHCLAFRIVLEHYWIWHFSEKQCILLLACCSLRVSPCTESGSLSKHLIVVQAGVATDKAYARKLEAKLSASKSISDLHARCSHYKLKLRELAQELDEAESRTASVQEIADVRADEVYISNASLAHEVHKSHVIHQDVILPIYCATQSFD